jgi:2-dehydro-3-deoxyphosphogluconate aldolase/(4S)-4-hydroxy-2-oxoglutarate aldolase
MALTTHDLPKFGAVIPVIVIDSVDDALSLAQALLEGGIRVLEMTLRTPVAFEAISKIAREFPEAIVGAGTIRSLDDLQRAKDCGAQFCVSPGYTSALGQASHQIQMPLLPGVSTASELMQASADGFHFLKLFPAEVVGGVNLLKAWASPFPDIVFCPTGGITYEKANSYLSLSNVACLGGSWLASPQLMQEQNWSKIRKLAAQASALTSSCNLSNEGAN